MCGICGFFGDFPQTDLINEMTSAIAHRGPDNSNYINLTTNKSDTVSLGHTRLSIIDLSEHGNQPMSAKCQLCSTNDFDKNLNIWITYNGEIYNFKELKAELIDDGHNFKTNTDTEVLIHLYVKYGTKMLSKLNGIFAFAIYDGRSKPNLPPFISGDLFVARDGLGVKPLYYSLDNNGFIFASELKSLLKYKNLNKQLDPDSINYYMSYLWSPAPSTPLKNVRKLKPGEALIIRDRKIYKSWYYFTNLYKANINSSKNINQYAEELKNTLFNSVKRQLIADVPLGAFLSGGLDSSAILAMAKKAYPEHEFQCFSIGFNDNIKSFEGASLDLPYAEKVANHLGVNLNKIEISPNAISKIGEMIYYMDEPQADPAPINALIISEAAKKMGIKVLLSGAGGDDILSGYRRHSALKVDPWLNLVPKGLRRLLSRYANKGLNGELNLKIDNPKIRRILKLLSLSHLQGKDKIISHFHWNTENTRSNLFSKDFYNSLSTISASEPLIQTLSTLPDDLDELQYMLTLETKHFLADHNLNYTDKMGMAHGVEIRVPLIDFEMVNFAATIPSKFKQKGFTGKAVFKKAMEPYLPYDVIYRPKTGFGAPIRSWMHNELKNLTNEVLSKNNLQKRNIFDYKNVQKLIELDKSNKVDASYTLFSILCIEIWNQIFIDGINWKDYETSFTKFA